MDRAEALKQLPRAYAIALVIAEQGADEHTIARTLEVPVESVPGLLAIGELKLATLLGHDLGVTGGDAE